MSEELTETSSAVQPAVNYHTIRAIHFMREECPGFCLKGSCLPGFFFGFFLAPDRAERAFPADDAQGTKGPFTLHAFGGVRVIFDQHYSRTLTEKMTVLHRACLPTGAL